nr:hypothetical protein [Tanacetum cinerariifolium]
KLTVRKGKEELELFKALDHKSVIVNEGSHKVVVFKKAPPRAYSKPFTRFSLPCDVDEEGAWDAKLDMADSFNFMMEERFNQLGFIRVDYRNYGRKMVKEVRVEIHGFTFLVDFVVIGYANDGEPSVIFGRDFLVTSRSGVDYGIGEMRIDLTMLEEMKDIDFMLDAMVENLEETCSFNDDLVNMDFVVIGYANDGEPSVIFGRDFLVTSRSGVDYGIGEMRIDLTMLEEMKDIDVMLDAMVENLEETLKVNRTIEMNALVDTGESVSVLPYCLFMNLGLGDPKPYNSNLTMADNTQAKAMGEVKNVRIQIEYQAYLVDFLILDMPMDKELPLLLGRLFLRTCGAVIDMGHEEEYDWLSCFEVRRDEDGNLKYGPVAPSFFDIKDDMERALAMEAYSNTD